LLFRPHFFAPRLADAVRLFDFFAAVFIFVVALSQQDRPIAASGTGDFELGFKALAHPTFAVGMLNTANIFVSTSGSFMFLPVISEMRQTKDYRKAVI